jgi:hypothetical protein
MITINEDTFLVQEENGLIEIKLKLKKEKFSRLLGYVKLDEQTFYCKREKKKHLLIKADAYGFNYNLLNEAKRFDKVMLIIDNLDRYLIPKDYILSNGSFLWFKTEGFERQIFLKMTEIEKFNVKINA